MRVRFVPLLIVAVLLALPALPARAQSSQPSVVRQTFTVSPLGTETFDILCPPGLSPISFQFVPAHASKLVEVSAPEIDANRVPIDFNNLNGRLDNGGGGKRVTARSSNLTSVETIEVILECLTAATFASTLPQSTVVLPNQVRAITSFCPVGLSAFGAVNNTDYAALLEVVKAPVFGSSLNPTFLDQLAGDGPQGAPVGYQTFALNQGTTPRTLYHVTLCANLPDLRTFVYTQPTSPGAGFSIFAPVPEGGQYVGFGYDPGQFGQALNLDYWTRSGRVASELQFAPDATTGNDREVLDATKAIELNGVDSRVMKEHVAPKLGARAYVALLYNATLAPQPAPVIVTVVEFYNASLDHYFITAIPKEISDLDSGVHPGWQRTGQSFRAYDVGSSGRTGRHPVCRAYGNPAAGLDSHFYSASIGECFRTLSRFNGAWLLEATEVFELDLPDPATGACPAGDVPVYRVFNNRVDANHRYTTSRVTRDQMVARGYIAEGNGPDIVALCALA